MPQKTHLYAQHLKAGAKIIDFGGWQMPIHYGSQIEEHHQVRKHAGMFDVSHMTILDMHGDDVKIYLQKMLANDVEKISQTPGKALYSCMLNENGGVIDDLICYYMDDKWYRVIVNAATRNKDIQWFEQHLQQLDVKIQERAELAMLAVQGPKACDLADGILSIEARPAPFHTHIIDGLFVARTGYTGEDGYEIICDAASAVRLWEDFIQAGVQPCGLGARDTLRLEAGMNLYGNDMDDSQSPLESGLGWTVDLKNEQRQFIGRTALEQLRQKGTRFKLVGLVLNDKGVLRAHQSVYKEDDKTGRGEITSGGFSPTMNQSIAFARIPKDWQDNCLVEIRKKRLDARIVKLPFVRAGKILV